MVPAATPAAAPAPSDLAARHARFRELHASGCFLIPNPWDVGSARVLAAMGFAALASTSSGHAFSHGHPDGAMGLDDVLAYLRALVAATPLPVNADFEDGFADDAAGLAGPVAAAIATGVSAVSIEDATGDASRPLYAFDEALERLRAARQAVDATDPAVMLVARCEAFLVGHPDPMRESLRRLEAFADAGADVLYAPGVKSLEDIATMVRAVAPRPLNVLVGGVPPYDLRALADLGVRRVSVGGALARAAWTGFLAAAEALQAGRFDGFAGIATMAQMTDRMQRLTP